MSQTRVYEFGHFKKGEMSIEDQQRNGRPQTSRTDENVSKIPELVLENRRKTIDELVDMTQLAWSSVRRILSDDLQMKRVAAKFVPRLLMSEQKGRRLEACREMKEQFENDQDFFLKVITGDESWCYGYDPETKQQSSHWKTANSLRAKKLVR